MTPEKNIDKNSWWNRNIGTRLSLFGRPLTKERLFNMYWLWDFRQARGSGLLNELRFTNYIPVIGVVYLLFPSLPRWTIPYWVIAFFLVTYFIGWLDERVLHYIHFESEKNKTYQVNPYERRIEKRLINIERALSLDSEDAPWKEESEG